MPVENSQRIECLNARHAREVAARAEIEQPTHYTSGGMECKDAMAAMMQGAADVPPIVAHWWGCVFKYVWRWHLKGGVDDLKKAREYLGFMVEMLEGESDER